MKKFTQGCFLGWLFLFPTIAKAQQTGIVDSTNPKQWKVVAGPEYRSGRLHTWLWGEDYRKEWTTPVMVPVLNLDSAYGGLTPVKEGGGRQTKSLRLTDPQGHQYVLRSVNKTYTGALPEIYLGSFVEKLANDQIATNHPYAALTVPGMAAAAGVYHTTPKYYLVPRSDRLGEFNETFANTLCLLEERPDETQTDSPAFGQPKDIVSTEKMMEKLNGENDHLMDQHAYLKTRLFDIFIGDWGRHKDNWRWAKFDSEGRNYYRPVPKDRDQTYAKFEGFLLSLVVSAAGLKQLQTFDENIRNIEWYNYPALEIDRRFMNQLPQQEWIDSAKALQQYLTDDIITASVQNMPPEIFKESGEEIIHKLKVRRSNLVNDAVKYYQFLAKEVEIPGSKERERFEVNRISNEETSVTVYRINKDGEVKKEPVFYRVFSNKETDELRLFGIGGNDSYVVKGHVDRGLTVRIIGGPDKDSLTDESLVGGGGHKTKYYDNPGNSVSSSRETKLYLSKDTLVNQYTSDERKYDSKGFKFSGGYNTFYRFYVGLGYGATKYKWRKDPFAFKQQLGVNFSLVEKSFHPYYTLSFGQLIGKWNLNFSAGYDQVRRVNYFGLGNETMKLTDDAKFNWLRTHDLYGSLGMDQNMGHHHISIDGTFDAIQVINNEDRYVSRHTGELAPDVFDWKQFAGGKLGYSFVRVNDPIVPSKGINFTAGASYTKNLKGASNKKFTNISSGLSFYLPLFRPFSLAIKTGAAHQSGEPEFYQVNNIGGYYTVRGYPRYRFYGETIFYNQNELRWIPSVKGRIFNGRIGLVALFDQGRVWQPGEISDTWHHGIGGGLVLVPFNKVSATVTYTVSDENRMVNLHFGKFF